MITAIIMASGFSTRMKKEKLLLNLEGVPIIEKVIKVIIESNVDEVILVYRNEKVDKIAKKYPIKTVLNSKAENGMSESVKIGINSANLNTNGYMFFLGDQPFIDKKLINKLIENFINLPKSIVVPFYNGKKGNPVIFSSKLKDELLNITGDKGGRDIIKQRINEALKLEVENSKAGVDIDTWEDYMEVEEGD